MEVKLPTSWKGVTLEQYIQLTEVPSLGFDATEAGLKVLSILTGVPDYYFLSFPRPELKRMVKVSSFVYDIPKLDLKTKLKINGNRYHVNILPSTLTAGEYIDLSELTKDKDKINANLPKILAIILQPVNRFGVRRKSDYKEVNGRYIQTLESRERVSKDVMTLTMDKVFPISDFFFRLYRELTKTSLHYLTKKGEKVKKEIIKDLQQIGVGS